MGKYLFTTPGGKSFLTFLTVVLLLSGLLFFPSPMGLADNSDFKRTLDAFGMRPADPVRYLSFVGDYLIEEPKSVLAYGLDLFRPVDDNPQAYYSTQYLFVKGALFLNSLYNKLTHNDPHQFRIVFQTALYIFFMDSP
jgi:hypothetical protein